jgi:hypothetical protein
MIYLIKIKGKLDPSWSEWLSGAEIAAARDDRGAPITLIRVDATDQPALFGILDRIRDLNLLPISIERIDQEA